MRSRTVALLIASAIAGAVTGSALGADPPTDPRVLQCGVGGTLQEIFELPRAKDIWRHLPGMKMAPELAREEGPASVLVYNGPVKGVMVGRGGLQTSEIPEAICVVLSSGEAIVYANVSRTGLSSP